MLALSKTDRSTLKFMRLAVASLKRMIKRHAPGGVAALIGSLAALALAGPAAARVVTHEDSEGRPITLDVRADDVDTEWYAELLRQATHGDEIATVTIRIVPGERLVQHCGPGASGCYRRNRGGGRIVVPAARNADVAHTLLHEYAHHIDNSNSHRGLQEPNGTPSWWAARKMGIRLDRGKVALGYARGWDRSIGEIFAEDYAQTQLATGYGISWLSPPGAKILAALERDLGALPATPAQPDVEPLVLERFGRIGRSERRSLPFGLLGPDRRVTFTVRLSGAKRAGTRARLELICGDTRVTKPVRKGSSVVRIDRRDLGPGRCQVNLVNTAGRSLSYGITLRLAVLK